MLTQKLSRINEFESLYIFLKVVLKFSVWKLLLSSKPSTSFSIVSALFMLDKANVSYFFMLRWIPSPILPPPVFFTPISYLFFFIYYPGPDVLPHFAEIDWGDFVLNHVLGHWILDSLFFLRCLVFIVFLPQQCLYIFLNYWKETG